MQTASSQKAVTIQDSRAVPPGEPRNDDQQPGTNRDEVKDADDVVRRAMVGALLIAVVQAVEPGHQRPTWQRGHEQDQFVTRPQRTIDAPARGCRYVGQAEADKVGGEQGARNEPPAPGQGPAGQSLARVVADNIEQVTTPRWPRFLVITAVTGPEVIEDGN